jgi:protein involved in temperature-dependent protein secretion
MNALGDSVVANPALRGPLRAELERSIRESPRSAHAHSLLANLDMLEGRWAEAISELKLTRAINPSAPGLDARQKVAESELGKGNSH